MVARARRLWVNWSWQEAGGRSAGSGGRPGWEGRLAETMEALRAELAQVRSAFERVRVLVADGMSEREIAPRPSFNGR